MKIITLISVAVFILSGKVFSSELSDVCANPKYSDSLAGDLVAHVAQIPGLFDSSAQGRFVDLIKALDDVYTSGVINIRVYPYSRAMYGVSQGVADFSLPAVSNPKHPELPGKLRASSLSFGRVAMVLYTLKGSQVRVANLGDKNLKIVSVSTLWEFPVHRANGIPQAFNMLINNRADGVIGAQEESDFVLRDPKYKNVSREHYKDLDDVFVLQSSERGQLVECVLYRSMEKLRNEGRLDQIYKNIHLPYSDMIPE